jgi:SAM-dependent methyltransferase
MKTGTTMAPGRRTEEALRRHYEIEKAIADRLRASSRDERRDIFRTMYDVVFEKVPDHPRLTAREDPAVTARANRRKFVLVQPYLSHRTVFVEIAPGDCRFAAELARHVRVAYGLDISDQRGPTLQAPPNFRLVLYDGFDCPLRPAIVDVAFSDQLLEHLHPDDVGHHVEMVRDFLKTGGVYIISTPHRYTGPHDISRHFSDEPQGFHLKEWTNRELLALLKRHGFRRRRAYWRVRSLRLRLPLMYFRVIEAVLSALPVRHRRRLGIYLTPNIILGAVKG